MEARTTAESEQPEPRPSTVGDTASWAAVDEAFAEIAQDRSRAGPRRSGPAPANRPHPARTACRPLTWRTRPSRPSSSAASSKKRIHRSQRPRLRSATPGQRADREKAGREGGRDALAHLDDRRDHGRRGDRRGRLSWFSRAVAVHAVM